MRMFDAGAVEGAAGVAGAAVVVGAGAAEAFFME